MEDMNFIHRKINRLGYVTRGTLALLLATGFACVVQFWSLLTWWTIGSFFIALLVALNVVNGVFGLNRKDY